MQVQERMSQLEATLQEQQAQLKADLNELRRQSAQVSADVNECAAAVEKHDAVGRYVETDAGQPVRPGWRRCVGQMCVCRCNFLMYYAACFLLLHWHELWSCKF